MTNTGEGYGRRAFAATTLAGLAGCTELLEPGESGSPESLLEGDTKVVVGNSPELERNFNYNDTNATYDITGPANQSNLNWTQLDSWAPNKTGNYTITTGTPDQGSEKTIQVMPELQGQIQLDKKPQPGQTVTVSAVPQQGNPGQTNLYIDGENVGNQTQLYIDGMEEIPVTAEFQTDLQTEEISRNL